jgi:coenzyme F420-dependent glucose-6-phosphate dehydrogenase
MTRYFIGLAQEQFPPDELLRQAVAAEEAGFDGISSSDHLQPWWEPGEAGHTWPWLGAAGQATKTVPLGTGVTSTGARYHPALIAQAWMTLERLFPSRMFLGIGSGEALNEVPVGDDWPSVGDQIARMEEALSIIDRLWKGEKLSEQGRFYKTQDTKLHTLADRRPPIWVSAFGPQAA